MMSPLWQGTGEPAAVTVQQDVARFPQRLAHQECELQVAEEPAMVELFCVKSFSYIDKHEAIKK